jgi:hypothetical protein
MMFNGVNTSGTSNYQVQIGSGSFSTTGYASSGTAITNATPASFGDITTGFVVSSFGTSVLLCGHLVLTNVSGNIWVGSIVTVDNQSARLFFGAGNTTISGALDRVRITTVNGTDTFAAGSVNIFWE